MPYDAFISYSHSADGDLAPALQSGLQRLVKPWYRRRPFLRVLLDASSFGASADLGTKIHEALDDANHLVLLLSPESARSPWISQEIEHWLTTKGKDSLTVVVTHWARDDACTEPELTDLGEYDWSGEDVPAALRGVLEEPLAVDLRWVDPATDATLSDERFRDAVAEIAAAIKGLNKDELIGEAVTMRTRARILTGAVLLGLAILAAAIAVSVPGWWLANQQRSAAEDARDTAEDAKEEAEAAQKDAEDAKEDAEADKKDAEVAKAKADIAAGGARLAEAVAGARQDVAEKEQARAEDAARVAEDAQDAAEEAQMEAESAQAEAEAKAEDAQAEADRQRQEANRQTALADAAAAEASRQQAIAAAARAEAERQLAIADSRRLANVSLTESARTYDAGVLVAIEGYCRTTVGQSAPSTVDPDRSGCVSPAGSELSAPPQSRAALVSTLTARDGFVTTLHHPRSAGYALSPSGRMLAISGADRILLWDLATREVIGSIPQLGPAAFTAENDIVVTTKRSLDDGFRTTFAHWSISEPASPELKHQVEVDGVIAAFGSHGDMAALYVDQRSENTHMRDTHMRIVATADGAEVGRVCVGCWDDSPPPFPPGAAFGVNDTLIAMFVEGGARFMLWDVDSGSLRATVSTPAELRGEAFTQVVAIDANATTAATGGVGAPVLVWGVSPKSSGEWHVDEPRVLDVVSAGVLGFTPGAGALMTAAQPECSFPPCPRVDSRVQFWAPDTLQRIGQPIFPSGDPDADDFLRYWAMSADGNTLALNSPSGTTLWDMAGILKKGWPATGGSRLDIPDIQAIEQYGRTVVAGHLGGSGRAADLQLAIRSIDGTELGRIPNEVPAAIAFDTDGTSFVSIGNVRCPADAKCSADLTRWTLQGVEVQRHTIGWPAALSVDGSTAAATTPSGVAILDTATLQQSGFVATEPPESVSLSADGSLLVTSGPDTSVWDVAAASRLSIIPTGSDTSLIAPSGTHLASVSDHVVSVWDLQTGLQTARRTFSSLETEELAFSADGSILAVGFADSSRFGPLRYGMLWLDVDTGQTLYQDTRVAEGGLTTLSVIETEGRTSLMSAGESNALLWDFDIPSWLERGCAIANRNLTGDEWAQFIGTQVPYRPTCPEFAQR